MLAGRDREQVAQEIRESATLLYSTAETAERLQITEQEFMNLLTDPFFAAAWSKGQSAVQRSLYNALINAALKDKSVPAIRLGLERLHYLKAITQAEMGRHLASNSSQGPGIGPGAGPGADRFAECFREAMQQM